jgi:hypothetical protein
MAPWKTILQATEKFVTDNSPGILTGLGVAGTVTTAVLAVKATIVASEKFRVAKEHQIDYNGRTDTPIKEVIELVWKDYIPTAAVGTATIAAIVAANHIGSRRAAAIAAAFKLSEQLSGEYKDRVVKTLGLKNEEKMRSELAADKMARTPGSEVIIISGSEVVFFDEWSGRYFKNEMETIRKAVNEINYKINNYYSASLSDFYEMIGLPKTQISDEFGWNTDELLDVEYGSTVLQDGRPAISISYNKVPIRGYDRCQ